MIRYLVSFLAAALLAAFAVAQPVALAPRHATGLYALGEPVGWMVTWTGPAAPPADGVAYTLKRNNAVLLKAGKVDLRQGPAHIETTLHEPAMVYLELAPLAPGEKPVAAGAAVAPEKLQPVVDRPVDFDAFWAGKIKWLESIPMEPVVTPAPSGRDGVEYATVRLNNINGSHVYGQLAKPAREGKFPAMLLMQWAGGPYPLQKAWVVDRAAEGWLVLNVEAHDVPGDMPQAFYDALPALIKQYTTLYNDDRERNYFLRMYLGDYRAADYLASRPDWNGQIFVATGTSMGGQQSFAVAGLHPKITHLVVLVPAGADANAALHGRHEGYPNWDSRNAKVMETARYFDAVNFASRIHAKSLVSMGFIDDVCPPTGVWTAFNQIAGPKEAVPLVNAAHNHQSTPEQLKPYTDRSNAWFARLVRGEEPDVR
jgi:cephalosporin-C deacetylase-like acetyl esterase